MALTAPAALEAQAYGYEEGIVELVAERVPALPLVVLVDSAGSLLLPVEYITYHLELKTRWDGPAFVITRTGGVSARVDTLTRTMHIEDAAIQLAPAEIAMHGPLLYLRSERIAALLAAEVDVDFATLTVTIDSEVMFPAQQRIVAEQRRAVVLARQRQLAQKRSSDTVPLAPLTGGGILDWRMATRGLDPTELTTLRADVGAALLGGDITAGALFELGSHATETVRDPVLRYHRVFTGQPWLSQLSAGDILSGGLFSRHVRGVEISNRPFLRSPELSAVFVQPDLPAGWEYEVFQGNELLGYSDLGTVDPVAVPLRAGTTPVQVRMYSPSGEEIVTTLLYQTPVSLLQRDAIEYTIGGGECGSGCDQFGHLDVRYGASALFTVGGGAEVLRDSVGSRFRPYFVYSMASGLRATAELTYMPFELYSANVALFPRDGSRANLRGTVSRPGLGPITIASHNRRRWDAEAIWDERLERRGSRFSQLRFGASASGRLGTLDRWRISSIGSFSRGFVELRYDHDNTLTDTHLLSTRGSLYVPLTIRAHRIRPLLTAALGAGADGIRLAEGGFSVQPRSNAVITGGVQWHRGQSRPTFSLSYTGRTGSVQSSLRAVSTASGVASSSIMLSGSAALAQDGSVTHFPSARTGYAGLFGTVFIDSNGDGLFTPGEETVPDAHLVAGVFRTASDSDGHFRIWGMQPYEAVPIAVDSARTPDPSLTTSGAPVVTRPAPNMARRVDVPLVRTRELIGSVTADRRIGLVAGVTLEITRVGTTETLSTVTFSDGQFYLSRIPPGDYELTVASSSLEALGAEPVPPRITFSVPASGDDLVVELPPVHLRPRE